MMNIYKIFLTLCFVVILHFPANGSLTEENNSPSERQKIWVAAGDGGGVRGIKLALMFKEIEEKVGPITKVFQMMAGTSTASITTGLALPNEHHEQKYTAKDLVHLYEEHSKGIFERSLGDKLTNPFGIRGPLYKKTYLENILNQYFKETSLKEMLIPTLITAYDIDHRKQVVLDSTDIRYGNIKACEAVEASCAAPGFFEPKTIEIQEENINLTDGCIFAINPAEIAYEKAKALYPNADIYVASFGTGKHHFPLPDNKKSIGIINGSAWTVVETFLNQSKAVHKKLKKELNQPGQEKRYFRIQADLEKGKGAFNDPSDENLKYLKETAASTISSEDFQNLLKKLKEHYTNSTH